MFYLDSSAFVKLVLEERRSTAMVAWVDLHQDGLVSSDLLRTEVLRAARRSTPEAVGVAQERLERVTLLVVPTTVFEQAGVLDPPILRSLDAIHLASALTLGDDLDALVTYDERLADAAILQGLPVVSP